MRLVAIAGLLVAGTALAIQAPRAWREYRGQDNIAVPPDYQEKAEWQFARLMYPPSSAIGGRGFRNGFGGWKQGGSSWTTDYSAADRHVAQAMRRLIRLHVRSVEQPIDPDDPDDIFYYPWLYAVEVGHWELTDSQVKQMREYLDRGGFFMVDDFHADQEWAVFMYTMQRVFPDRQVVDIPNNDQIFHVVHDLDGKFQVPGARYLSTGSTCEQCDYGGSTPHWRGIYDDKGRIVVAICHNMDLGDAWEYADYPQYDAKFSGLAFRIVANYISYSMTH